MAAVLFFQLINARYEPASTVLTSNKGFEEWGAVLGDEVMAAALIDRLLHHCHIVNIRGNSYRMRGPSGAEAFHATGGRRRKPGPWGGNMMAAALLEAAGSSPIATKGGSPRNPRLISPRCVQVSFVRSAQFSFDIDTEVGGTKSSN